MKKWIILDLFVANRFWTFINVQKSISASGLWKKREKTSCDHYALILVFG